MIFFRPTVNLEKLQAFLAISIDFALDPERAAGNPDRVVRDMLMCTSFSYSLPDPFQPCHCFCRQTADVDDAQLRR